LPSAESLSDSSTAITTPSRSLPFRKRFLSATPSEPVPNELAQSTDVEMKDEGKDVDMKVDVDDSLSHASIIPTIDTYPITDSDVVMTEEDHSKKTIEEQRVRVRRLPY